jgi:hypothetical protein
MIQQKLSYHSLILYYFSIRILPGKNPAWKNDLLAVYSEANKKGNTFYFVARIVIQRIMFFTNGF